MLGGMRIQCRKTNILESPELNDQELVILIGSELNLVNIHNLNRHEHGHRHTKPKRLHNGPWKGGQV